MNGFVHYENDCDKVWIYRLECSYGTIQKEVALHTGKHLKAAMFELNSNVKSKWASWNPSNRVMCFSSSLLRNYEWAAVEHVMRHEVAHQIVSEIFGMDCYGVAHGAAWQEACKIVNIDPKRCESSDELSEYKGTCSSPMVEKVRKILIHANDEAATEAEAETFMRKAKELMLRHDIAMKDVIGSDRLFVTRPFGPLLSRWSSHLWKLGGFLAKHYDVKYIKTYGPNCTSRLELFGEPDKLDIAEYVGHALLNQAELLYEQQRVKVAGEKMLKRLEKRDLALDGLKYTPYSRKLSKRAFIEGVISGYSSKMDNDSKSVREKVAVDVAKERCMDIGSRYTVGDMAIVPVYNERLLNEMHGKAYGRLSYSTISCSRGGGYNEGHSAGRSLRLSKGVDSGGNGGRLLGN